MEDEALPIHELLGNEPAGSPEDLREIVGRAERRRWRGLAGGLAMTLVVGGAGGYVLADRSGSHPAASVHTGGSQVSAAATTATTNAGPPVAPGAGVPPSSLAIAVSGQLDHLFTRTVNHMTIRGFLSKPVLGSLGNVPANCRVASPFSGMFQAEVSTDAMVGEVGQPGQVTLSKPPIGSLGADVVGTREGDPRLVVMAQVDAKVTDVSVTFADGTTDHMAPVQGWAALTGGTAPKTPATVHADQAGPPIGVLTAKGAIGVLAREPVSLGMANRFLPEAQGAVCAVPYPVPSMPPATGAPAVVSPPAIGGAVPTTSVPTTSVPGAPNPAATTIVPPITGPVGTMPQPGPAPAG